MRLARLVSVLGLALLASACSKCGDININAPWGGPLIPKSCTPSPPSG